MMKKPFNKNFQKADIHLKKQKAHETCVCLLNYASSFSKRKEDQARVRGKKTNQPKGESKEWP
jgi:hypothetical protein